MGIVESFVFRRWARPAVRHRRTMTNATSPRATIDTTDWNAVMASKTRSLGHTSSGLRRSSSSQPQFPDGS